MRRLLGHGTPKGAADAWNFVFIGTGTDQGWFLLVLAVHGDQSDQVMPIAVVCSWGG